MTILAPRPEAPIDPETEALIREARRLRHARWLRIGLVLIVAASGTVLGVWLTRSSIHPPVGRGAVSPSSKASTTGVTGPPNGLQLKQPANLAIAPDGDLYIADIERDQVLVRLPNGTLRVVAGDGIEGNTGDGGDAARAEITHPNALTVAPDGVLYFMSGSLVRAVSRTGMISTVVGGGPRQLPISNGADALDVDLRQGDGLAVAPTGVLYLCPQGANEIFALKGDKLIEVVHPSDLIGVDPNYPEDHDIAPYGIAFDRQGDLFISTLDPYAVIVRRPDGTFRYVGVLRGEPTNPFAASGTTLYAIGTYAVVEFSPDVASRPLTAAPMTELVSDGFKGHFADHQYFDPGGIAIAPNGDIVTDGDLYGAKGDGEGSSSHAVLVAITPSGEFHLLEEWSGSK